MELAREFQVSTTFPDLTTLRRLPLGGGWCLWSWFLVRSAGFPARWVLGVAAPRTSAALDAGADSVEPTYREDAEAVEHALRAIAMDPRFREALTWQNRAALATGVDRLLAIPVGTRTSKPIRARERLIASYLQRYCLKNDTIGFFGPTGWGTATEEAHPVTLAVGPSLLSWRAVYFEHWAIETLARVLASETELRRQLPPRLLPTVSLTGSTLRYGFDATTTLEPAMARLLACCDGSTPATEIARVLAAEPALGLEPDEVFEALDDLVRRRVVQWSLEVPASLQRHEQVLEVQLRAIANPGIREAALAKLARLVAARDAVAASAGDPVTLGQALDQLDATFVELTQSTATRREGQAYAGRSIVYEECVRDTSLTIGRHLMDVLGPVLELLGCSARWYSHEIARRYRALLVERHRALCATGETTVSYMRFFREIAPLLPSDESGHSGIVGEVTAELQRRWREILGHEPGARRVDRTCTELAAKVREAFVADAPGWPSARHLAPDVMLAASDAERLARGEYAIIIGEVHLGNTLLSPAVLSTWQGEEGAIVTANEQDLGVGRVFPVEAENAFTRADLGSWSVHDLDLELGANPSWKPRAQVLRVADLDVELAHESLEVVDRRSGRRFDIIAFLEQYLGFGASGFHPWPDGDHVPRITLGGVVVSRERWRFSTEHLAFARLPRGPEQLAAFRRWAAEHGIPRWTFARVPTERKPVFLDRDSALYVDLAGRLVRKSPWIEISEMLPSVEQLWLPDAAGERHTCELRLVVVDPVAWRPG
jgi:hypothetical protein